MMREFPSDILNDARGLLMSAQRRIDDAINAADEVDRPGLRRIRRKVEEAILTASGVRDAMLKEGH